MIKERILLVDDEPEVLSALSLGLRKHYTVFTCSDPGHALELVSNEGPFPVIISDLKMPEMSGIDFLEFAKKISPESSGILLTGQGEMDDAIRAVNSGIVEHYLSKPCKSPDLNDALNDGVKAFKKRVYDKRAIKSHEKEHKVAHILQDHLVHSRADLGKYIECEIKSSPLNSISGDFYEIIPYRNDCYDIIIGDVMGKGLSAALAGVAVKNVIHLLINDLILSQDKLPEIADILHLIEHELHEGLQEAKTFITLFYLRVNLSTGKMSYINRGHPGAILLRESSELLYLTKGSLPLGVLPTADQQVNRIDIEFGDQILLYTDGLSEALGTEIKCEPCDLIMSCLSGCENTPSDIIDSINTKIKDMIKEDDMTVIALKLKPIKKGNKRTPFLLRRDLDEIFRLNRILCDQLVMRNDLFKVAVIESFTNIVKHDQNCLPIEITVETKSDGRRIVLLSYEGSAFEPDFINLPDCDNRTNGFGLYLIEKICDEVDYFQSKNGFNNIRLTAKMEA